MPGISHILFSTKNLFVGNDSDVVDMLRKLPPGRLLAAKVLQYKGGSSRKAVLSLLGRKITVDAQTLLKPGETILLRAEQSGSETILKMAPSGDPIRPPQLNPPAGRDGPLRIVLDMLSAVNSRKGASGAQRDSLEHLKALLSNIALKSETPDTSFLSRLIRDGGFKFEQKLQNAISDKGYVSSRALNAVPESDIKGFALKLLQMSKGGYSDISRPLRVFVEQMEHYQLFNKSLLEISGKLFFSFPIFAEEEWRFGQMLIHLDQESGAHQQSRDKLTRLSVLLDLSRLGPLAADFSLYDQTVNGYFTVADESAKNLISSEIHHLKTRIRSHGFIVEHIGCRLSSRAALSEISLAEQVCTSEGLLNLVI